MARSSRSTSVTKKSRAKTKTKTRTTRPRPRRTGPKRRKRSQTRASPPKPEPVVVPGPTKESKDAVVGEESGIRPPYEEGIFYATRTGGPLNESQEQRRPFRFRRTPWRFFFMIMGITVLIGGLIYQRVAIANALRRKKTDAPPTAGTESPTPGGDETPQAPSVFEANRAFFIVVAVVITFFIVFVVLRQTGFGRELVAGLVAAVFPERKPQPPPPPPPTPPAPAPTPPAPAPAPPAPAPKPAANSVVQMVTDAVNEMLAQAGSSTDKHVPQQIEIAFQKEADGTPTMEFVFKGEKRLKVAFKKGDDRFVKTMVRVMAMGKGLTETHGPNGLLVLHGEKLQDEMLEFLTELQDTLRRTGIRGRVDAERTARF